MPACPRGGSAPAAGALLPPRFSAEHGFPAARRDALLNCIERVW